MRRGFTILEMSIVLVIIGLLVGGILLSRSLIRNSQVQTIVTDVATYQDAIAQFKQKYSALPGDITSAQTNWGVNTNCASGGSGTGTQTCNGDGNGQIDLDTGAPYEQYLVWQHLANGGFIQGSYTGAPVSGAGQAKYYCKPNSNCPVGRINRQQAYYLAYLTGAFTGSTTNFWDQPAGAYLFVGSNTDSPGNTSGIPAYPLLSAEEAYSLDAKVDDGLPGQGMWKSAEATGGAGYLTKCVVTSGTATAPANGALAAAATSVYYTAYGTRPACAFEINLNF